VDKIKVDVGLILFSSIWSQFDLIHFGLFESK